MVATLDGGGGTAGPFDRYPVTPGSVWAAGDRVASYAGNVETLQGDVTASHRPAQLGVAGLLADPMAAAEHPVQARTQQWLRSTLFASGAVRLFGDAVGEYNRRVDDLNRRYWDAKNNSFGLTAETLAADATPAERAEADESFRSEVASADQALLAQLQRELYQVVEPGLDDEADYVAQLLDRGPDNEAAVVALYAAGTLPWTTPLLFPQHDFTSVPVQLPRGASGTDAAETIRRALAGDASPEEFQDAMLLLQIITNRAEHVSEHGGHLTTTEVTFLHDFYNELGDRIWDVPAYIQKDSHSWDAPWLNPFGAFDKDAPGFDSDTQDWLLGSMGIGLIALSNNQLWPPRLRAHDPMDPDSRYHLPETVIDLVTQPALDRDQLVQYPHLGPMVDRWDDFKALSQLLEQIPPDIEAGTRFSEQATIRVAELAAGGQVYQDSDTPGLMTGTPLFDARHVSEILGPIIEVSTRNDEANYRLLTGQATGEYVRLNLHDDLNDQQFLLAALYGFEWSDDGATAAGLTDWIGVRADAAALDGEYDPMATEAAAALIDLVTATELGEGHDGPDSARVDMYDRLMADLSERNPEIARSFSRVAASYLADFAEPSGPETRVERNGSLSLSDHDKIRFLDLIATDDQAINGLSFASGEYQQRLLVAALTDDEISMIDVGQQSSRLDGLLAAARVNAGLVTGSQQYENQLAAYEEHMRYASYGKTAATTITSGAIGASPLKPIGPYLNAGLGHLADEIINGAIPAPERDDGYNPGDILDLGRDETYAAHEYLTAMILNDQFNDYGDLPDGVLETAPPYSGAPFETTVYENGRPVLVPVAELDGGVRRELFLFVGHEHDGIGGDGFDRYRNDYNASGDYQQAVARNAEAHRQGLR